MKKYFLFLFLMVLNVCAFSTTGIHIEHWKTTHDVPVYFVSRPELPMMDIAVIFNAGSAYDNQKWGLATLTAGMLNEGTRNKSASDIAEIFDAAGALYNADTSRDLAIITLRTLTASPYFSHAVHMYLELLSQPSFNKEAFQRLQQQTVDSIKISLQDPATVAAQALFRHIYGTHPYAHPSCGTVESVQKLTPVEVQQFYQRYYVAHNAKIILVGNLSRPKAAVLAENIASALASGEPAPPIPVARPPVSSSPKSESITMDVSQTSILLGLLGVDYQSPHYFDLLVANHILGGATLNSLLMREVRDKQGYTYGVFSQLTPLAARGPFIISLKTRAEKSHLAEQAVLDTLKKYNQEGPTLHAVSLAQAQLSGKFLLDISSNAGILSYVIFMVSADLPLDYLEQYTRSLQHVTPLSAKKAFRDVVDDRQLTMVRVGRP